MATARREGATIVPNEEFVATVSDALLVSSTAGGAPHGANGGTLPGVTGLKR